MERPQRQVTFADELVTDLKQKARIDPHLLCPSCKKRFITPLLLPCLHSICKTCLDDERLAPKNGKIARCPSCTQALDLNMEYPVNFVLNNLANTAALGENSHHLITCDSCDSKGERVSMRCDDCFLFLCTFCATAHRRMSATKSHHLTSVQELQTAGVSALPRPCFCAQHPGKQIICLCVPCGVPVCRECVVSQHREHNLQRPEQVCKHLKHNLTSMSEKIKRKRKDIKKSVTSIYDAITKLESHYQSVRNAIEEYFEAILKAVKQRMQHLLSDLDSRSEVKLDKMRAWKVKLEATLRGAQTSCEFTDIVLSQGSDLELISVSHVITQRLLGLYQDFKDPPTMPSENESITFSGSGDGILSAIDKLGVLEDSVLPTDPSLSTLSETTLHVTSGQVSHFELTAVNQKGMTQTQGGDKFTLALTYASGRGSIDNSGFRYNVQDNNDGSYRVNYVITKPDSYRMHVLLGGCPVTGSPITVTVTPKDWIGSGYILRGEGCGGFANPHSILTDRQDNLIIADSNNHQIKILNSNGGMINVFGKQGSADGQFKFPYCLTLNQQKSMLLVSDGHNHRVQILTITGRFIKSFGDHGDEDGLFNLPHGIAMDPSDNIYVADSGNSRLQIFTPEGYYMRKIVSEHLSRPWGVAITQKGQIAVTDYNNHTVFIFHRSGKLDFQFGSRGEGDGEFNNPAGITIDSEGQFVVADRSNHRVQIFQPDGTYVTKFGGKGTGDGLMRFPAGVAVDRAGHLYVADTFNNRIQVFSLAAV